LLYIESVYEINKIVEFVSSKNKCKKSDDDFRYIQKLFFETSFHLGSRKINDKRRIRGRPEAYWSDGSPLKSFMHTRSSELMNHTRRTYSGEKLYACEVCTKPFAIKGNLTTHTRTQSGRKPYTCEVCTKPFATKGNLTTHTRTHSEENQYTCEVCTKSFARSCNLTVHTRTQSGEKLYSCEVCTKSFGQRSSVTMHARIHDGDRPRVLWRLNKSFADNGNLARHASTHGDGDKQRFARRVDRSLSNT